MEEGSLRWRDMFQRNFGIQCVCLCFIVFLLGCASNIHKKNLLKFDSFYCSGKYHKAVELTPQKELQSLSDLLNLMQVATAMKYANQYKESCFLFDKCEEILKSQDEEIFASNVSNKIITTFLSPSYSDYRGTIYDGIMINTYKALSFWKNNERDLARVEINRAIDRQRRAKERFAVEIQKLNAAIKKSQEECNNFNSQNNIKSKNIITQKLEAVFKKKKKEAKEIEENLKKTFGIIDIEKNLQNPELNNIISDNYSNLDEFRAYKDFINPFTTYIAALFFIGDDEYSKSLDFMKETYGMTGNSTVEHDFISIEEILNNKKSNSNFVWIIFENGLGPIKEEFRVDIPIMVNNKKNKIMYTGIALPKLKFREPAFSHLNVKTNEEKIIQTEIITSMDRIIQTEFSKRYPMIIAQAVVSTVLKLYIQQLGYQYGGLAGGYTAAIYNAATTEADIRIWSALPKEFQIGKIKTPKNGLIIIETPCGIDLSVNVMPKKNSLIYIKIPSPTAEIVIDTIEL
jgi:uncharacterized protein